MSSNETSLSEPLAAEKPEPQSSSLRLALRKPINSLTQLGSDASSNDNDVTRAYEDEDMLRTESTIWYPKSWNRGEGYFNWKGSSSRTGQRNYLRINWSTNELEGFVAQCTNLNNDYEARPGYFFKIYDSEGGTLLREKFMWVCRVADEDWHTPPCTEYDRANSCVVDINFNYIEVWQQVAWA